jgi:hypothetical protein
VYRVARRALLAEEIEFRRHMARVAAQRRGLPPGPITANDYRFHNGYRKMAEQGTMVLTSFKLTDVEVVFPNEATAVLMYHVKQTMALRGKTESVTQEMTDSSTWVHNGEDWLCAIHTETPFESKATKA